EADPLHRFVGGPGRRGPLGQQAYPLGRFFESRDRHRASAHCIGDRGTDRRALVLGVVLAEQEQIGSRGESSHRGTGNSPAVAHSAHLESVRDDHAVEAELVAPKTERTPAPTAAANGASSCERLTGSSWCESARVAPWPGKCFAHAATPWACVPSTNACTCRATSSGSEPNERTPITGFSGSLFTSATGARFQLIPIAASSPAIAPATRRVSSTSSTMPSARFPGTGEPSR